MSVIDHFLGGEVVLNLPQQRGEPNEGRSRPRYSSSMKISVSNVTQQEGLPSPPNPHFILMLSFWFPRVQQTGGWVPVTVLTDDIPAQEYGEMMLLGTPVHLLNYPIRNFYIYPRSHHRIDITNTQEGLIAQWRGSQAIDLPLNRLPTNPLHNYYMETDQSFMLHPFTLKFIGYGDKSPDSQTTAMPILTRYAMTQTSTKQAAYVDFTCPSWSIINPLKAEGTLYEGERVFTFPPSQISLPPIPDHW